MKLIHGIMNFLTAVLAVLVVVVLLVKFPFALGVLAAATALVFLVIGWVES